MSIIDQRIGFNSISYCQPYPNNPFIMINPFNPLFRKKDKNKELKKLSQINNNYKETNNDNSDNSQIEDAQLAISKNDNN